MPADLHDLFTYEGAQFNVDPTKFEMGRDFLERLRTYDPTAHFLHSGDVNAGEGGPRDVWELVFDATKLPARPGGQNFSSLENTYRFAENAGGENGGVAQLAVAENPGRDLARDLYSEDLQSTDPIYGRYTDARNWKPDEQDWKSRLLSFAPAAILGLASLGTLAGPAAGMLAAGEAAGMGAGAAEGLFGLSPGQLASGFNRILTTGDALLGGDGPSDSRTAPLAPALQAIVQARQGGGNSGSSAGMNQALLLLLALASQGRGTDDEG